MGASDGRAFQFLFKYPAFVFDQGDFTFAVSRGMVIVIVALAALVAVGALVTYRGSRRASSPPAIAWC